MRSDTRRGLRRLLTLSLFGALASGCATTPPMPVMLAALKCGPLIPESYRHPVSPAPLLPPDATAGDALTALDGQTASLDRANSRTTDVIAIVDACDKRSAEVAQALKPKRPFWKKATP
jgi:hypothetical protein